MTARNTRSHDRRILIVQVITILLMGAMTWWVHSQQDALNAQRSQLGDQREAIVEACNRLQILRVQDNVSHFADYKVFRVVYVESRAQERSLGLSGPRRKLEDAFLAQLDEAIHAKQWVPLTDCNRAVALHGAKYRPPAPVAFIDRRGREHLPPADQLVVPEDAYR